MGYYPKHFRRRLHRARMRAIAMAALAGCVYQEQMVWENYSDQRTGNPGMRTIRGWCAVYPDGAISRAFRRKSEAAMTFLEWFYEYKLGLKGRR